MMLALLVAIVLPACSTTKSAANATADAAEDVADATADVATSAAGAVADAAGASYNAVADLFDDDDVDAAALIRPVMAGSAQGTVTFDQDDDGVEITVSLRDLTPGEHGLHVHTNGSCNPPGNHFDPMSTSEHGAPDDAMSAKHVGDLGNITANGSGTAEASFEVEGLTLTGANGLVGHAIVVHSGQDDLESQPSGDSGDPVGCGVITGRE